MENSEFKKIIDEIEKVKFHNISIITLLGLLNDDKMAQPTIQETVVTFDLSKNDLREFTKLIQNYDSNNFAFEKYALEINPVFTKKNIISILKSFVVSQMLEEKCLEILKSYE